MVLRIQNNVRSLNATRHVSASAQRVSRNFKNLSTGHRVNSVSDNAASYLISTGMNARLRVIGQVIRNITDGVTLAQTADSALTETTLKIQEVRELAVQASGPALDFEQRFGLQVEADKKLDEIDHLGATTRFGGISLLNGQVSALRLQSGPRAGDDITVRVRPINTFLLGQQVREDGFEVDPTIPLDPGAVRINEIDVRSTLPSDDIRSTAFRDGSAIAKARAINDAQRYTGVEAVAHPTEVYGLFPLGGTLDNLNHIVINGVTIQGFEVLQGDVDKRLRNEVNARTDATGVEASLDGNFNLVLTAPDGRNIEVETTSFQSASATGLNDGFAGVEVFGGALQLKSLKAFTLDLSLLDADLALGFGNGVGVHYYAPNESHALGSIDITNQPEAERSIEIIDVALQEVHSTQSDLGAVLSQLESALSSNESNLIHLEVSRHRIQDIEVAAEIADYAKNHVVQRAGVSILAQANFGADSALKLLRNFEGPLVQPGGGMGLTQRALAGRLDPRQGSANLFRRGGTTNSIFGRNFSLTRPEDE